MSSPVRATRGADPSEAAPQPLQPPLRLIRCVPQRRQLRRQRADSLRLALRPGGRPGSISRNGVREGVREDRGVATLERREAHPPHRPARARFRVLTMLADLPTNFDSRQASMHSDRPFPLMAARRAESADSGPSNSTWRDSGDPSAELHHPKWLIRRESDTVVRAAAFAVGVSQARPLTRFGAGVRMETISTKLADVNGPSRSDSYPVARSISECSCIDRIGERSEHPRGARPRVSRPDRRRWDLASDSGARDESPEEFVAARWCSKTGDTTSENAHSPKERSG
jgi:hypothetical protein